LQQGVQYVAVHQRFRGWGRRANESLDKWFSRAGHGVGDRGHGEEEVGVVDEIGRGVSERDDDRGWSLPGRSGRRWKVGADQVDGIT
jgi:hypothetical protein